MLAGFAVGACRGLRLPAGFRSCAASAGEVSRPAEVSRVSRQDATSAATSTRRSLSRKGGSERRPSSSVDVTRRRSVVPARASIDASREHGLPLRSTAKRTFSAMAARLRGLRSVAAGPENFSAVRSRAAGRRGFEPRGVLRRFGVPPAGGRSPQATEGGGRRCRRKRARRPPRARVGASSGPSRSPGRAPRKDRG